MTGIAYKWTDWVDHDGKGCPFPAGLDVECEFEEEPGDFAIGWGLVGADGGMSWDWSNWQKPMPDGYLCSRIVRYRVKLVDCPALTDRAVGDGDYAYPARYDGKVPVLVRMGRHVRSDVPFVGGKVPPAELGRTYPVWVNRHGAVTAVFRNGKQLGLKPGEFFVLAYFDPNTGHVVCADGVAPVGSEMAVTA